MRRGTSIMRFSVSSKENEVLLKTRGLYLFTGLAGGSFNPYVTSLLVHQGMTSQNIGIILAFGTLLAILFVGLGGIAGNLLNGYLLETGGPGLMYFSCTVSAALGTLLLYRVRSMALKQQHP